MKIYREYTKEPYSFSTIDTTLPANDPSRFRKDLLPLYKNNGKTITVDTKYAVNLMDLILKNKGKYD